MLNKALHDKHGNYREYLSYKIWVELKNNKKRPHPKYISSGKKRLFMVFFKKKKLAKK